VKEFSLRRLTWFMFTCLMLNVSLCISYAEGITSVNGVPINTQRYYSHYQVLLKTHPNTKDNKRLELRLAKRVILPLVTELLLREESKRININLAQVVVNDPIIVLKKTYKTPQRLEAYLQGIGETEDSLRRQAWINAIAHQLMKQQGRLFVGEDQVRAEYKRQRPFLSKSEQIKTYQVLIKLPKAPSSEQVNKAFKKAQDIHQKLLDGALFSVMVQRYSEGPLRSRDGDMGFVRKGEMVQSVETTIWALKKDEISTPIRSKYGWHIIKRGRRIEASQKSYDEVKSFFEQRLIKAKFRKEKRAFIKELWSKAKIDSPLSLRY